MATLHDRKTPVRPETPAERHLARGFTYLTLDPSARLRRLRESQETQDTFKQAWILVGNAIRDAIRIVAKTVRSQSR
jgi:hypothetical protein